MAAGVCAGPAEVANTWMVCADRGRIDGNSRVRAESDCPADRGKKSEIECGGDYDLAAFLGLGVGRNGAVAGDSDYGDAARDLRSYGIVETGRKVAERIRTRYQRDGIETN